jgi:CHAT domain-containing protein/tetratricopeptide (TPR) repeat protein
MLSNAHPLYRLAEEVAHDPSEWERATAVVRREAYLLQLNENGVLDELVRALQQNRSVAAPPLGFLISALLALAILPLGGTLFGRVGMAALRQPFPDERLIRVIDLFCEDLCRVPTDEATWAGIRYEAGAARMRMLATSETHKGPLLERAIQYFEEALSRPFADTQGLVSTLHYLGLAYLDRPVGDRGDNIGRGIEFMAAALDVYARLDLPLSRADARMTLGLLYAVRERGASSDDETVASRHVGEALSAKIPPKDEIAFAKLCLRVGGALIDARGQRPHRQELAISCFRKALSVLSSDRGPSELVAHANARLGELFRDRHSGLRAQNIEFAIQHLELAIHAYLALEDAHGAATAITGVGYAYQERVAGNRDENIEWAISCHKEAISLLRPHLHRTTLASTLCNLGVAFQKRVRGDPAANVEDSIRCFTRGLELVTPLEPNHWARLHGNLANSYTGRTVGEREDNLARALASAGAALTIFKDRSFGADWAGNKLNSGNALLSSESGNRESNASAALAHFEEALAVYTVEDFPVQWALATAGAVAATFALADADRSIDLTQALERCELAANVLSRHAANRQFAQVVSTIGALALRLALPERAYAWLMLAAELAARDMDHAETEASARIVAARGIRIARQIVECVVTNVHPTILSGLDGARQQQRPTAASAAFWTERFRAQSLKSRASDASQRAPGGVPAHEYEEYLQLRSELRDVENQLYTLSRFSFKRDHVEQLTLRRESLFERLRRLRLGFTERDPIWTRNTPALGVDDLRDMAARSRSALLTLQASPRGVSAIGVFPNGRIECTCIEQAASSELAKRFGEWMLAQAHFKLDGVAVDQWMHLCKENLEFIGENLWRPLRAWLERYHPVSQDREEPNAVVIIPDSILGVMPLHAASWLEEGVRRFAGDDYVFSYAPSISILQRCLERESRLRGGSLRMLAVQDPTGDLDFAAWEVARCLDRFTGPSGVLDDGARGSSHAGTRDRVLVGLRESSIALISGHMTYDFVDVWRGSGIYTADGPSTDPGQPFLSIRDLFETDLSGIWLAVLSGCESAQFDMMDASEEQFGLPSSLLVAGAATVVGSLWSVNDAPTALLTSRFFEELFAAGSSHPRTTKARALWAAQRWLRTLPRNEAMAELRSAPLLPMRLRDATEDDRFPYEHPLYWAGFGCYGA